MIRTWSVMIVEIGRNLFRTAFKRVLEIIERVVSIFHLIVFVIALVIISVVFVVIVESGLIIKLIKIFTD